MIMCFVLADKTLYLVELNRMPGAGVGRRRPGFCEG